MSLLSIFNVASSAMAAQSQRLNTVASNIANADTPGYVSKDFYRAKHVVFSTEPVDASGSAGVKVNSVIEDPSAPRLVYDPKHPMANGDGYVAMPNVNPVDEMVNMISASRSYQNNVEVMNTAKSLLLKTLQMGQ